MARPYKYKVLNQDMSGYLENHIIGIEKMYGIKHGEDWVVIATTDTLAQIRQRKYYRPFLATRVVVQKKADELNKRFSTNEYKVVEI
jgi:hypothetical protein